MTDNCKYALLKRFECKAHHCPGCFENSNELHECNMNESCICLQCSKHNGLDNLTKAHCVCNVVRIDEPHTPRFSIRTMIMTPGAPVKQKSTQCIYK
jgi:hypothetical protein